MKSLKEKYCIFTSIILLFVFSKNTFLNVNGLYTTKTAYLNSFTNEQLEFLNNSRNYEIKNCVLVLKNYLKHYDLICKKKINETLEN
jgi:hypothetical protein